MSYIDQERRSRPAAIGGVVLLHVAIGYAFISGLAYRVIHITPPPILVHQWPDDKPPPPARELPKPPPRVTQEEPTPTTVIDVLSGSDKTGMTPPIAYPPFKPADTPPTPPPPPTISHARKPVPAASRASWVTADDYPAQALREEVQGVTGIDVTIGADGRVTACAVTASSGSDQLDQATCRLYARRARFQPALDDDGKATAGHYADRIRWTIPQ